MSFENSVYNSNPYYDDFDASKGFARILFRPGFSVQARELTQLQTLLHNQMKSFGDHVFENGSLVSGGQISESAIEFARIDQSSITISVDNGGSYTSANSTEITTAFSDIIGREFGIGSGSYNHGIGKVVTSTEQNDDTIDTYGYIFFNYMTGITTLSANNIIEFETSSGTRYRFSVKSTSTSLPETGKSRVVTTQAGLYYIDGTFVITTDQKTVPYAIADGGGVILNGGKVFDSPTARVGFTIADTIVTSDDDTTLLDPANGFSNFAAPGADRLKKTLTLGFTAFDPDLTDEASFGSDNFIEILRYENGIVTKREIFPDYSVIEETIARRTYDQAGNYTVSDFGIQIREHLDDGSNDGIYTFGNGGDTSKIVSIIEPGKAYILGNEFETISRQFLDIDKARTTDSEDDKIVDANIGSYVLIGASAAVGILNGFSSGVGTLNSQDHPVINLADSSGATFGSALFRQLDVEDAATDKYRMYLYDIELASGGDFANTDFLYTEAGITMAIIGASGADASGNTIQFSPTSDSLVIPLPVNASIQSVDNIDYDSQLSFESTSDGSGTLSVSVPSKSGDPITFPGDVDAVVATSLLNNRYFLINRSLNTYIDDFTGITFTTSSSNSVLTITGLNTTENYTVLANCQVNTTDVSFFHRSKVLGASESVTGVTLTQDVFSGTTYGNIGRADVYVIESIIGETASVDYTDRFVLDDGQRDNLYDHARINLAPGQIAGDTIFTINFKRFIHSTDDGPFVVDSYPVGTVYSGITFGYENIPSFTSNKTGIVRSLRNVIDFRPTKKDDGTVTNAWIPVAKESMSASFTYYLPRIDKITLTKDREFKIVSGIPSLNPIAPDVDSESMTLYSLRLGAYTFEPADVEIQHHETKRYTMGDIGQIEKRVDDLEYFSSLSFLEQDANSRTFVTDANTVIPKVGILVDNFNGHEIGDVNSKDYNCSMNFDDGTLRPAFNTENIPMLEDASGTNIGISNGIYTLEYTSVNALSSPLADNTNNINPTDRIDWYGNLNLETSSDSWFSTSNRSGIRSNKYGVNDAWEYRNGIRSDSPYGFGTQWKDWEYNWFGIPTSDFEIGPQDLNANSRVFDTTFTGTPNDTRNRFFDHLLNNQIKTASTSSEARKNIAKNSTPDSIFKTLNGRKFNTSIQPYNRLTSVSYSVSGMKPNTVLYVFADNIAYGSITTDVNGSNSSGSITFLNGSVRSGDILIRVIDDSSNNLSNATTVSEAVYKISGDVSLDDSGIRSTRPSISRRASVSDESIISTTFSRNSTNGSVVNSLDAMSQNFTVDKVKYPKGMFVSSLDLMFASKPTSFTQSDIPVSIELRPTVSGYPHPSKIIPGTIIYKNSGDVTISNDTDFTTKSNKTNFAFDYPVYLKPGEYSIVIRSNSDGYVLYTGVIGNSISSSERITQQPFVGKYFQPQNAGTYIVDNTQKLTFGLNRCKFNSSGSIAFKNNTITSEFIYDSYYIHSGHLDLGLSGITSQLTYQIQTTDAGGSTLDGSPRNVVVNQTVSPSRSRGSQKVDNGNRNILLTSTMVSDDDAISPVIDIERLSFTAIENSVINSSSTVSNRGDVQYNGELDPSILDSITSTLVSNSRYISKSVILEDGISATDIRVILDINTPTGTDVQVFVKALSDTDTVELEGKDYIELNPSKVVTSSEDDEYTEVEYGISDSSVFGSFDVFTVKIVLHSSNQFIIPSVRDMRAIALA